MLPFWVSAPRPENNSRPEILCYKYLSIIAHKAVHCKLHLVSNVSIQLSELGPGISVSPLMERITLDE